MMKRRNDTIIDQQKTISKQRLRSGKLIEMASFPLPVSSPWFSAQTLPCQCCLLRACRTSARARSFVSTSTSCSRWPAAWLERVSLKARAEDAGISRGDPS